ncbi:MAG: RecX family transcriptional regulator [Microgenomates group bacterium]
MPKSAPSNSPAVLTNTAIRFLSYRSRFKAEVINRLAKKAKELQIKDPLTLINQITESLERAGFIDDEKNLESFIRYQLETKRKGPYWIKSRLAHYGLTKGEVEASLKENAPPSVQLEIIRRFIEKKTRGIVPDLKTKAKLYRALVGRGFSASLVADAFDGRSTGEV